MPTIIPKYTCKLCNEVKNSKQAWERHMIGCRYRHMSQKERDLHETTLPSQQVMFQMILDLTVKCTNLEKKIERFQSNQSLQTRKSIMEYLLSGPCPNHTFTKWAESIVINKQHLKIFFDNNLVKAINQSIVDSVRLQKLELLPIRNYSLKPNDIYIYDTVQPNVFEWKKMDTKDWKRFCNILTKKIKVLYFEWKKENQEQIDNHQSMSDLNWQYSVKINNADDIPFKPVKDTVIKQIQLSLTTIVE